MNLPREARLLALAALLPLTIAPALRAADAIGVACQGRILPASRVLRIAAYSETGAPVVARLLVAEDAEVKAGDTLAELASAPAADARVNAAKAELLAARLAVKSAEVAGRALRADALLEISAAEAALAAAKQGNSRRRLTDDQLKELSLAVAAKESEIARLRESRPAFVTRADKSVDAANAAANALTGDSKDAGDAETARARAARELALRDYDTRLAGEIDNLGLLKARLDHGRDLNTLPQTLPEELSSSERRLELARARVADATLRAETDLARANAEAEAAGARLAQAEALSAATRVKAPVSGTVLSVHARTGEAVGADGLVEIGDLSKIIVLAEVVAADLPRTAVGRKAVITVPGIEKPVTGVVSRVGRLVGPNALAEENPSAFKDLRVAPVEILVDDPAALAGLIRAQVTVRIAP